MCKNIVLQKGISMSEKVSLNCRDKSISHTPCTVPDWPHPRIPVHRGVSLIYFASHPVGLTLLQISPMGICAFYQFLSSQCRITILHPNSCTLEKCQCQYDNDMMILRVWRIYWLEENFNMQGECVDKRKRTSDMAINFMEVGRGDKSTCI